MSEFCMDCTGLYGKWVNGPRKGEARFRPQFCVTCEELWFTDDFRELRLDSESILIDEEEKGAWRATSEWEILKAKKKKAKSLAQDNTASENARS